MKSIVCVIACAVLVSGCASVVRGTSEDVVINVEPADAEVTTTLGHSCKQSPCTIEVSRKKTFMVRAEKEGYKPGQVFVDTKVSGGGAAGLAGNILLGGVVGVGVDAISGATLDHTPNPVYITLVPVDSESESTNITKPEPPVTKPKAVPVS
ncbi:translation initiation factor 2 [Stappia indica]|uniref:translation initiation factor 2 n=1 Tax=Stappia indica TaxID=538381 RepID=UPI000833D70A|nr:translation initiation factor 2 [Stappia indica]